MNAPFPQADEVTEDVGGRVRVSDFDKEIYLDEMRMLLQMAKERMRADYSDFEIYTINIWTDPDARRSAINFDSLENSTAKVNQQNEWSKEEQLPLLNLQRNFNSADFALREIAVVQNQSFPQHWEQLSEGECWNVLEPALIRVGELARVTFSDLSIHPEAELSVNSRLDWYDHTWKMRE